MSDEAARHAIRSALDTTMMVEAGAGSGKTTLMVDRLVAYALRGTPVETLAAVTFTRKAANELRERFESRLETESRNVDRTDAERTRLHNALRDRERMFIGTVHAFCARILREHALDAGLPLDFSELDELESQTLRIQAWRDFLERHSRADDLHVAVVAELGIDLLGLSGAFEQYERYRDAEFEARHESKPAHEEVRDRLLLLLQRGFSLRNAAPSGTRDELQKTIDRLWNGYHTHTAWQRDADFAADARTLLVSSKRAIVQKRWGDSRAEKAAAKQLADDFDDFANGQLATWFGAWWAHAYPHVITLFKTASDEALAERRRNGHIGFDDLLTETARLLRNHAPARRALGARWRHLLVDEFQDTDPVQAEVCFLLASNTDEGTDWRTVRPREGSLFVVGDPKQSIYRFRRADLATYRLVEHRIRACGIVERLTQNFRSVPEIGALANAHFQTVFSHPTDAEHSLYQAPFAELVAVSARPARAAPPVAHYFVGPSVKVRNDELVAEDAAALASWIADRCNADDRTPQDFLVLTATKRELAAYAHELALRNIPVAVSGASGGIEGVIAELLIVVRALADPGNAVSVIAALEGWCFGCSHVDLWNARKEQMEFRVTHAPAERTSAVGVALQQLYEWWLSSQRTLPATLIERILDESGLLLLAACGDLGDRTAGQLLQLVTLLRDSAVAASSLTSAIAAIERVLQQDENDPTLRVGRTDAVRLMNLHKAKGLEAPVVILAAPVEPPEHAPSIATWRNAQGDSVAAMTVTDDSGVTIAQPQDWHTRRGEEVVRQAAERDRLLYVAVTRAQDELVVARRTPYTVGKNTRYDASAWAPLASVLDTMSAQITIDVHAPPGRVKLQASAQELAAQVAIANSTLRKAKLSRFTLSNVTDAAKRTAADAIEDGMSNAAELRESMVDGVSIAAKRCDSAKTTTAAEDTSIIPGAETTALPTENNARAAETNARDFGSFVHLAIEGALRGRRDSELQEYVRAIVWHATPQLSDFERASLVAQVLEAVQQARTSDSWKALTADDARPLAELNVASYSTVTNAGVLVEGIVDAAVRRDDGWLVVDWKNSAGSDAGWASLMPTYSAQAEAYLAALEQRTAIAGESQIVRIRTHR